ncbi:hypothetical protein SLS62_000679 [Diatrype stigma]|uniref:Anoctamin n=1 Tax=Diatrype stigma TaxID=117547 RepID=A0AAN9V2B3_9PEZI
MTHESVAVKEFLCLCRDLREVGLQIEVQPGESQSLLIFAKAPKDLLVAKVYKSRVKDYLYGITDAVPEIGNGYFEAEDILSVYHLVSWSKENGGAGITPGLGKWKNVKSIFPIHNGPVNEALLKHLSTQLFLRTADLDRIRNLFGSKVAFYFAFMQTYLRFLSFSAVTGALAWAFLPKYSFLYAVVTLCGCTVFLEYWKIRQAELCVRWNVRGVEILKVNQHKFRHEKIIVDAAGRTKYYFPRWKTIARQLLQIPFFAAALLALGAVITLVFAVEIIISEAYDGPYKWCLEYLPTLLLAAALPSMNSCLEFIAAQLAEYENHRTLDHYDMSLTQKLFGLSFIANYLPILLSAFVYIPLGDVIVPQLQCCLTTVLGERLGRHLHNTSFRKDTDRLRNELIALTITGQLCDAIQEFVVPYIMHRAKGWYSAYRSYRSLPPHLSSSSSPPSPPSALLAPLGETPSSTPTGETTKAAPAAFLRSVRQQASLPRYNVQYDMSEMAIQLGHLALFAPVWPLVSVGFFVNNWLELRSDFFKICADQQRPHPVRADGLGPWVAWLDTLVWLGSICTAAIVHVIGGAEAGDGTLFLGRALGAAGLQSWSWWCSLPVTIWMGEHVFLAWRSAVRFVLKGMGSDQVRRERVQRYARRKKYIEELEAAAGVPNSGDHGGDSGTHIYDSGLEGAKQAEVDRGEEVGIQLIKTSKMSKQD